MLLAEYHPLESMAVDDNFLRCITVKHIVDILTEIIDSANFSIVNDEFVS